MADLPSFQGVTGRQLAAIPTVTVEAPAGWVAPASSDAPAAPSAGLAGAASNASMSSTHSDTGARSVRSLALAGRTRSASARIGAAGGTATHPVELPMCAVCMEEHIPGSKAKKLPCGHLFVSTRATPVAVVALANPPCLHQYSTNPAFGSGLMSIAIALTVGGRSSLRQVARQQIR
ncbi:hypothetical protein HDU93_007216 [Gonapodya sp. JEL0774]|nr:hypothetical protein HDU93_007216 [Gonapodya sp. JEL0774]